MSSNGFSTDKDVLAYLLEAAESGRPIEEVEKDLWNIYGCKRAVLAMDSSGFSRISESHGVAYFLSALMKARKVIEAVLKEFHCLHYRFEADNLHADFESPTEALRAALSINEALKMAQIPISDNEYFRVCVGIGYGELLMAGREGVYGNEMNRASRLGEDTAKPREILLTEEAFAHLDNSLAEDFSKKSFEQSGTALTYYRLKL